MTGPTVLEQENAELRRTIDALNEDRYALRAALRGLLDYAGGWDAPADHPCGIARTALSANA